jgi:hypothetical protein
MTTDCGVTFWGIYAVYSVTLFKRRERIESVFTNIFYYEPTDKRPLIAHFFPNAFGGLSLMIYDMETATLLESKNYDALGDEVTE